MVFARATLEIRGINLDNFVHDAIGTATFIADAHAEIGLALATFVVFPEGEVAVFVEARVSAAWTIHVLERLLAGAAVLFNSLYIVYIIEKIRFVTMRTH